MIIHIDTGKTWRGGQQQAFYLHQSLCKSEYESIMICKKRSCMAKKCEEHQIPFLCLPLISEIDIYSAWKVSLLLKNNGNDILHLHTAHALSIGLLVKMFCRDIKLIGVRRVDFSIKKSMLSNLKYQNTFLDVLVCISKNIYDVVLKDGVSAEKLRLIHSGIDTNRYAVLKSKVTKINHPPKQHLVIGTIAAYVGHKDYPTLLKAARLVLNETNNVTFIAIGDGVLFNKMKKIHDELQLGKSFIMAGFQQDIKKYLHSFDIFVLASKKEGLGTSVLDAMSARKAIVACNCGGIPEMIKHNINGLLAEKENPNDLAEKILFLIKNSDLRERVAAQAEIDVQKFSIKHTINKNIELYRELTEK